MVAYLELIKELVARFEHIEVEHVLREENTHEYALANLGYAIETSSAWAIPLVMLNGQQYGRASPPSQRKSILLKKMRHR